MEENQIERSIIKREYKEAQTNLNRALLEIALIKPDFTKIINFLNANKHILSHILSSEYIKEKDKGKVEKELTEIFLKALDQLRKNLIEIQENNLKIPEIKKASENISNCENLIDLFIENKLKINKQIIKRYKNTLDLFNEILEDTLIKIIGDKENYLYELFMEIESLIKRHLHSRKIDTSEIIDLFKKILHEIKNYQKNQTELTTIFEIKAKLIWEMTKIQQIEEILDPEKPSS